MTDEQKRAFLVAVKPILLKLTDASKSLEEFVVRSRAANKLDVQGASMTMRQILQLQPELQNLVDTTCYDLGDFGISMTAFVSYEFKASVHSLVDALKLAIHNNDLSKLPSKVEEFKGHPATLVDIIKTINGNNKQKEEEDKLIKNTDDNVTRPQERHLPKCVLVITEYENNFGKDKMINGIKAFEELKQTFQGKIAFVKVRKFDDNPIQTKEKDIAAIPSRCDLETLRGYPYFIMIKDGNYYWFRNTNFQMEHIVGWLDDVLHDAAYITGKIDMSKIPEIVKWFWELKGETKEHLDKAKLKDGSPKKQSLVEMGEAPDMWHEMWFTAISEDSFIFHLDSLLDFQKKFRKNINPATTKEWNYKFIFPSLDWTGWQKLPYLGKVSLDDIHIESALAALRNYMVVKDNPKLIKEIKSFFGELEEEPESLDKEPENYDISEFGKIGDIKWDGPDVDDSGINLDGLSKEAKRARKEEKASAKAYTSVVNDTIQRKERGDIRAEHSMKGRTREPLADMKIENSRAKGQKTDPNKQGMPGTVQDQVFDYLDEMLSKNVLAMEIDDDEIEDVDL